MPRPPMTTRPVGLMRSLVCRISCGPRQLDRLLSDRGRVHHCQHLHHAANLRGHDEALCVCCPSQSHAKPPKALLAPSARTIEQVAPRPPRQRCLFASSCLPSSFWRRLAVCLPWVCRRSAGDLDIQFAVIIDNSNTFGPDQVPTPEPCHAGASPVLSSLSARVRSGA